MRHFYSVYLIFFTINNVLQWSCAENDFISHDLGCNSNTKNFIDIFFKNTLHFCSECFVDKPRFLYDNNVIGQSSTVIETYIKTEIKHQQIRKQI